MLVLRMRTYIPNKNFRRCAQILDNKTLKIQIIYAYKLWEIMAGNDRKNGWRFHPCYKMWSGHIDALALYTNEMIFESVKRGMDNEFMLIPITNKIISCPTWLGRKKFHSRQRSRLLEINRKYYSRFGWKEKPLSILDDLYLTV